MLSQESQAVDLSSVWSRHSKQSRAQVEGGSKVNLDGESVIRSEAKKATRIADAISSALT